MYDEKEVLLVANDLREAVSYDEWSAREYGEMQVDFDWTARSLIDRGYRKQHSWISVDKSLPDLAPMKPNGSHVPKSVRVLCACKQRSGKSFVKEGYYEWWGNKAVWRIPGSIDSVTHWMPLPTPPEE